MSFVRSIAVDLMKPLVYSVELLSVKLLTAEVVNARIDLRQVKIYPVVSVAAAFNVQALGHRRDLVEVDCANAFLVAVRIIVVADFGQDLL